MIMRMKHGWMVG